MYLTTPTTFPRFGELPTELQIEIFQLAASPHQSPLNEGDILRDLDWGDLEVSTGRLQTDYGMTRHLLNFLAYQYCLLSCDAGHDFICPRRHLKDTCRLARLIALEAWRKDMAGVVALDKNESDVKGIALSILKNLIEYVVFDPIEVGNDVMMLTTI